MSFIKTSSEMNRESVKCDMFKGDRKTTFLVEFSGH